MSDGASETKAEEAASAGESGAGAGVGGGPGLSETAQNIVIDGLLALPYDELGGAALLLANFNSMDIQAILSACLIKLLDKIYKRGVARNFNILWAHTSCRKIRSFLSLAQGFVSNAVSYDEDGKMVLLGSDEDAIYTDDVCRGVVNTVLAQLISITDDAKWSRLSVFFIALRYSKTESSIFRSGSTTTTWYQAADLGMLAKTLYGQDQSCFVISDAGKFSGASTWTAVCDSGVSAAEGSKLGQRFMQLVKMSKDPAFSPSRNPFINPLYPPDRCAIRLVSLDEIRRSTQLISNYLDTVGRQPGASQSKQIPHNNDTQGAVSLFGLLRDMNASVGEAERQARGANEVAKAIFDELTRPSKTTMLVSLLSVLGAVFGIAAAGAKACDPEERGWTNEVSWTFAGSLVVLVTAGIALKVEYAKASEYCSQLQKDSGCRVFSAGNSSGRVLQWLTGCGLQDRPEEGSESSEERDSLLGPGAGAPSGPGGPSRV